MNRIVTVLTMMLLTGLTVACSRTITVPVTVDPTLSPATGENGSDLLDGLDQASLTGDETGTARPAGWAEASHGNDAMPDYDTVFPQNSVNTVTITIDPDQWAAMQADMTGILGEAGTGQGGFGAPGGIDRPDAMEPPPGGFAPPDGMEAPGGFARPNGAPGMGNVDLVSETPMWVEATITFDGQSWSHVGIRYKGNSSLASTWREGSLKLPFKLDFDQFEDDYPAIDNQRFYGFKQMSFANGFSDDTYLRETLTYDLMREAGLAASQTAFYEIILDYGEGPLNLGIYTAVEVIDDTVIAAAFGDDSGNIYEADGAGASLADGTLDLIADSFEKENNEDEADWSDIEALYAALHAETRITNPEQWRAGLEATFDVDTFLNWLAVSAMTLNWDAYGAMTHNYYLYHDVETGRLVWLPWDHNMTFGVGAGRERGGDNGFPGGGPGGRGEGTFDKADVTEEWPLIRFLLDDPVYHAAYLDYLGTASDLFDAQALTDRINTMADLIRPTVAATGDEAQFDAAVDDLIAVVAERDVAAADFLEQ